jgi:hypothetical protein
VSLSWSQALAWRMRRQLLDPVGTESVAGVVGRLGAVPAWPDAAAELAVRCRRQRSRSGVVAGALAEGRIIKTFAFRGATHLLRPEGGSVCLALRAASQMWELPSWQSFYGLAPSDRPRLRAAVRDALADGPMTQDQLGAADRPAGFPAPGLGLFRPASTLLKPLAWQGDMSFGPPRDGQTTFQRLDRNPRWNGLPEFDDAGASAVEAYFRAYGPASPNHLHYWLGEGLGVPRKRIQSWARPLRRSPRRRRHRRGSAYVLRQDLEELAATPATAAVRSCRETTNWSSVRAPPVRTSCRPQGGRC